MSPIPWQGAIAAIEPHVVRITTPHGSGTGFLVSRSKTTPILAIATAAHVVDHVHYWEEPVRIQHHASKKTVLLRQAQRAINLAPSLDLAAIVFDGSDLDLPEEVLDLAPRAKHLLSGVEIGWVGFPAVHRTGLCFFSGHISAWVAEDHSYLVDGVAINGVSGGPAFKFEGDRTTLVGVISAYIPNRATGETLPGLSVVQDVAAFHTIADNLRSLDEAKATETPPDQAPAALPEEPRHPPPASRA